MNHFESPTAKRCGMSPSAKAAAATEEVLSALLADTTRFFDSDTVGRHLSGDAQHAAPRIVAGHARNEGRIIGAWDGRAFRYPAFQFDDFGQPLKRLPELISISPTDADGSRRNAMLWLFAPDGALGERSPAEVFPIEPGRVIALRQHRLSTATASE